MSSHPSQSSIKNNIKRYWICGVTRSVASRPSSRCNRRTARRSGAGWTGRFGRNSSSADPTHPPLNKMGAQDDPEAFLDLFEKTAGAPDTAVVRGSAGGCSATARTEPTGLRTILSGLAEAQSNIASGSVRWTWASRPFVMAKQLRDSCRKWLLAEGSDVEHIVDWVVQEQFITRLPRKTAEWVQCHRLMSLDSAIQLAEDKMVACPGVGEPLPAVSLSSPLFSPSPCPSSQVPSSRSSSSPTPKL